MTTESHFVTTDMLGDEVGPAWLASRAGRDSPYRSFAGQSVILGARIVVATASVSPVRNTWEEITDTLYSESWTNDPQFVQTRKLTKPFYATEVGLEQPKSEPKRREKLRKQIQDAGREAAKENWDGENSTAVSSLAVEHALELAGLLPTDVADPEVYPTPNGEIDFNWTNADWDILIFSFNSNGGAAWAAEFNESSSGGTLPKVEGLPCFLEGFLQRFLDPQS